MTKKLMTAALAIAALATVSIATSAPANARGGHGGGHGGGIHVGGAKIFVGGGRVFSHRFNHRHFGFYRFGYGYNSCWKYTPAGLVNVCVVY